MEIGTAAADSLANVGYTELIVVSMFGVWAGLVKWLSRIGDRRRRAADARSSIGEFIADLATSSFVTVTTFIIMLSLGVNWLVCVALSGVAGHMGSRTLFVLENRVLQLLRSKKQDD